MDAGERQIEAAERSVALETDAAIAGIRASLRAESDGHCIDCEAAIDARRLAALPSAQRCIACQKNFEGGRFGGR